jgi:2-haloacid dehalogenase
MIITNGLRDVQRPRIAKSAIGGCFAGVVISEEVGASKPDGRIFEVAFERMGCPRKEDVLIVGDSLSSDMQGGSDYGIDTCWFNPQKKPRDPDVEIDYEIRDLRELLALVEVADGRACR